MAFLSGTLLNFYTTGDTICFLLSTESYLIELFEHCGCCFQCLRSLVSSKTLPKNCLDFYNCYKVGEGFVCFLRNPNLAPCKMFDLSLETISLTFPCLIYCSRPLLIWFFIFVTIHNFLF